VLISVIIPSYNHAPFLEERIRSVLQQTFSDFEVIIIDDASTDNSRDIIESFRHSPQLSHIIYKTSNSGSPFGQWREALALAGGKWIWIAESDDSADLQFLEKMISVTEGSEDTALVYCDSLIRSNDGLQEVRFADKKNERFKTAKWSFSYKLNGKTEINQSLKWECVINNTSAVLFNRRILETALPAIEGYRYHGDWLLYLLLATVGDIAYLAESLNNYRQHTLNHSQSEGYLRQSKVEQFKILDHLAKQDFVTEKRKLTGYFIDHYIGFGFMSEPAFGTNGILRQYAKINPQLARQVMLRLLLNRLKRKKTK
jgi:glycosyltransferase involved in cell wall biosynthesis